MEESMEVLPSRAELARELLSARQILALFLGKMGGEARITKTEMDLLPRRWKIEQREEVDGSMRFTLVESG